ncbi:MAG: deoxynucleoside kinase [Candidatus Aenigmarchaeota archaeon]|nr:deoxynucleoside kinase [Candidatus Aenigmarchaeota archaeon]
MSVQKTLTTLVGSSSHLQTKYQLNESKIITFIGIPGSGKSSVAREMSKRLKNGVLMEEIAETAANKGFEVADRASIGTETWFLTQYYTRGAEAQKLVNEGKIVIMDGNYANSLAFGFANFVNSNNPSFFMHFPSYIVNKAVGTLVNPDVYIVFKISLEESVKRQEKRGREELKTKSVQVIKDVDRFYKLFFSILEPEIPVFEVDAEQPFEEVIKDVQDILKNKLKLNFVSLKDFTK